MVETQAPDIFAAMQEDLDLVSTRVAQVAEIEFPIASAIVREIVKAGGKRLRPLVLLLTGRGFAYDRDTLITAAAGVELLHTASLIHDDSIDHAALRRGQPTLNSQLSSGAVILIGDYLFAQSAMLAAATNNTRVVAIFASTLGDLCNGQLLEMFEGSRLDQERAAYERRIYGKTASLFAGAAEMGAVIGLAPAEAIEALRGYGAEIGLAFQIMDDVLDLRESTDQLGKPAGNDLRQGTITLPTMIYRDQLAADGPEMRHLQSIIDGEETDESAIDAVIAAIRASGGLQEAESAAAELIDRAKARLSVVSDTETRELLERVADLALARSA